MCISLLFGRLGGIFGTNAVALLLESYCEVVFYSSGLSIMGQYLLKISGKHVLITHSFN